MVKYGDAPSAEVRMAVAAAPAALWPLISDIEIPTRFSSETQRVEWIDDGPALGATFQGFNEHPAVGEWSTVLTVTGYEEGRLFEWTSGVPENKAARWRLEVEPDGEGSTLRFSAEMGPGPSGLSHAINAMPDREEDIVANRLREWTENMTATIEGIKGLAEGA